MGNELQEHTKQRSPNDMSIACLTYGSDPPPYSDRGEGVSGVTGGGGGGRGRESAPPPRLSTGKFLGNNREKTRQEKNGKCRRKWGKDGKEEEENEKKWKREGGK